MSEAFESNLPLNPIIKGYDAAGTEKSHDSFNRWVFANNLATIINQIPLDFSLRIGIYGKWGEGKTTVLNYIEKIVEQEKHIVFKLNTSIIGTAKELWFEFTRRLIKSAKEQGVNPKWFGIIKPGWYKVASQSRQLFKYINNAAEYNQYAKAIANTGTGLLESLFNKTDKSLLNIIQKELKNKRIVVLIDELDRIDPNQIPNILLILRELLDLPQLVFVLAFDRDIIAKSLQAYNSAWGEGNDFLDKIIEFPFHLPKIADQQKIYFIKKEIRIYCSYIPEDSINQTLHLLPNNPRKLKLLIRKLALLKSEVERYDKDELHWPSIIISELIRLESEEFLSVFSEQFSEDAIDFYALDSDDKAKREDANNKLQAMLVKANVENDTQQSKIKILLTSWSQFVKNLWASLAIPYMINFSIYPHTITWKEFRAFFQDWKKTKKKLFIEQWLENQSKLRNATLIKVADEFFSAAIELRQQFLERAANSHTQTEQEAYMHEADLALKLIRILFLDELKGLEKHYFTTADRFKFLYLQYGQWLSFRANPMDKAAREQEELLLINIVESDHAFHVELLEVIKPWYRVDSQAEIIMPLKQKLAQKLELQICRQILEYFTKEDCIVVLKQSEVGKSIQYFILRSGSPFWKEPFIPQFKNIIEKASQDINIYKNCCDYLSLCLEGANYGLGVVSSEEVKKFILDDKLKIIPIIWDAILSRKAQFRALSNLREDREKLLSLGVPADWLIIPDWLTASYQDGKVIYSNESKNVDKEITDKIK